jgi:hypothetical protein
MFSQLPVWGEQDRNRPSALAVGPPRADLPPLLQVAPCLPAYNPGSNRARQEASP